VSSRVQLIGTRLALLGTVLYLSEWLVIPFVADLPTDDLGDDPSAIAGTYADHGTELGFTAGYLSFALLGRVLFIAAIRDVLRDAVAWRVLLDVAVGAMAISVAIEIVQLGLTSTAAWLAESGVEPAPVVGLDGAATVLFTLIIAPIGASVVAASTAMLLSGLFPRWLGWLGVIAGGLVIAGGIVGATGAGDAGTIHDLADPLTGPPVAAFWLWMIATSVVLFRRAPARRT
jgi:hypothetical protein